MKTVIDWSKAPVWATAYAKLKNKEWYYYLNDTCYAFVTNLDEVCEYGLTNESTEYFLFGDFDVLVERPKPETKPVYTKEYFTPCSPVYTQDMADSGELPSVGMECCYSGVLGNIWNKCTIIAYYDGFVWTSDNGIRALKSTKFKPLDTRTDNEKAFDKFLDINYNSTRDEFSKSESDRDFIEGLELAFNAGIQLLEVKS